MGSSGKFQELGKGVLRRRERRKLALFIDGTGLDRACRRLNRKVDMSALVRGVSSGLVPAIARYYTLIPYEDDSRQRAFLDAVARAGLSVVVKRLPPKGVNRQVDISVEMASDIVAFSMGLNAFSELSEYKLSDPVSASPTPRRAATLPLLNPMVRGAALNDSSGNKGAVQDDKERNEPEKGENVSGLGMPVVSSPSNEVRLVTTVCPSRELSYTLTLIKTLGVDTTTADFGQFNSNDILKSAAKWMDLSDSETIWRE